MFGKLGNKLDSLVDSASSKIDEAKATVSSTSLLEKTVVYYKPSTDLWYSVEPAGDDVYLAVETYVGSNVHVQALDD